MYGKLKIEKGIPIPPRTNGVRGKTATSLISEMEVGDSILVDTHNQRTTMIALAHRKGVKVVSRKMNDGYRIWRTE